MNDYFVMEYSPLFICLLLTICCDGENILVTIGKDRYITRVEPSENNHVSYNYKMRGRWGTRKHREHGVIPKDDYLPKHYTIDSNKYQNQIRFTPISDTQYGEDYTDDFTTESSIVRQYDQPSNNLTTIPPPPSFKENRSILPAFKRQTVTINNKSYSIEDDKYKLDGN